MWNEYKYHVGIGISVVLALVFAFLSYYLYKQQSGWMFATLVAFGIFGIVAVYFYTILERENKQNDDALNYCMEVGTIREQVARSERQFSSIKDIDDTLFEIRSQQPMGFLGHKNVKTCENGLKLEWLFRMKDRVQDQGNTQKLKEIENAISKLSKFSDENEAYVAQEQTRLRPVFSFGKRTKRNK